jgi:hypothetical protein
MGSVVYHPDMQVILRPPEGSGLFLENRQHRLPTVLRYFMKWGITF